MQALDKRPLAGQGTPTAGAEKGKVLTNEELCTLYQNGDTSALWELFTKNSGLIESIIRKYSALEDIEDLRQESFFAIRKAALLWDHSKGGNFATYCTYWVKQVIFQYAFNCRGVVRVPISEQNRIRQYNKVLNACRIKWGREPTERELCALLEITPKQLRATQSTAIALRIRSTSEPVGEEGESTLEDFIADNSDPIGDAVERIQAEELHQAIEKELKAIPEDAADILRRRYYENLTINETSAATGITPAQVKNIESRAIRNLRRPDVARRLIPYLTEGGAYSMGLKGGSLGAFKNGGASSQERALIWLEERTGKIWKNNPLTPLNNNCATQ